MRILHLSDLHLTDRSENFSDIQTGLSAHVTPESFDFVVVSGDLSQKAAPDEYKGLLDFSKEYLLSLLKKRDPARVVFVPGNHDVDWSREPGSPLPLSKVLAERDAGPAKLRGIFEECTRDPRRAPYRLIHSLYGHVELCMIDDEKKYASRFENVQEYFLKPFYGDALKLPHRPFNLTSNAEGDDWSAHVFPEDGVAFFGFNSCYRNDKYWHGAAFNSKSINDAQLHAQKHAKGLLRVAVWHHGIRGDSHRPDYLSYAEIGNLYNADFRIGLHGHVHQAQHETLEEVFDSRFVLVATGSLGAASHDRPGAVGKQFTIINLTPGQVETQVYERADKNHVYRENQHLSRRYEYPLEKTNRPRGRGPRNSVGQHQRDCHIDQDGKAIVNVSLSNVALHESMILAFLVSPYGTAMHDEYASTDKGRVLVKKDEQPDRRVRYYIEPDGGTADYKWLKWSYQVSNAYALSAGDLALRERAIPVLPNVDIDTESRPHHIRFACEQFKSTLRFDRVEILPDTLRVQVERAVDSGGSIKWELDEHESSRCSPPSFRGEEEGAVLELNVDTPRVGYRYGLCYKFGDENGILQPALAGIMRDILERCRCDGARAGERLDHELSITIEKALAEALGGKPLEAGSWMGLLWDENQRRLLPAFGRFANRYWGVRFPSGTGIAGHAFRFSSVAAFHREHYKANNSIFYQSRAEGQTWESEHEWVVCIPLFSQPRGPSVGVISIESAKTHGEAEQKLRNFADGVSRGSKKIKAWREFSRQLFGAVNIGFWNTLTHTTILSSDARRVAAEVSRRLKLERKPRASRSNTLG